jgi:hypothetical protein
MISSPYFRLHSALSRGGERRGFVIEQMEPVVLLGAVGIADARVAAPHEKCLRAVPRNAACVDLRAFEAFAAQTFDWVAPHCLERPDQHGRAFIGGFRFAWPEARAMELRPMSLRPLDFAGILERALAFYAQNFVRLVALVAVTVAPVAIAQYLVLLRVGAGVDATLEMLQHPERLHSQHVPTLFNSPGMLAIVIASGLFSYYMLGFAFAAVAAAAARRYAGEPIGFRTCYEEVLPRWGSIVAVIGAAVLGLVAAYMAAGAIALIPLLAAAALGAFSVVATFAIVAMLVAIAFAFLLILVATACALCAVVVERYPAASSLRLTVQRVFNRSEFWRALLCAATAAAIGIAVSTLVDAVAFAGFSRWPAAYVGIDALERIIVVPFLGAFFAVYYFDVRIRYEGFDLTTTLAAAGGEPVYAPTAYLSGEERAVIKRFLERRDSLSANRRREIASQLAEPVRERVPPELARVDDESLLERLG